MHIAGLPTKTINFIVADDGVSALADDNASGLLDHDAVAFAHLATGATHVIETPGTILRRGRHEGALRLRGGGSGRWSRWLQRGGSDGWRPGRLLWRDGPRWLADGTADAALTWLLRAWRGCRRLCTR